MTILRAIVVMALLLSPVAVSAQVGRIAVDCVAARAGNQVSFALDFERRAVVGTFPINWAWFARGSVLFGYSVQIDGDYQTLQSYALDHATKTLEICDFASGGEQACERRACHPSGQVADPERPARNDTLEAIGDQKVSLFSVPESSLCTFSLCLKMITNAMKSANILK